MNRKILHALATLTLLLLPAVTPVFGGTLYGVTDEFDPFGSDRSLLYILDTSTGAATFVGSLGQQCSACGLAYDSGSNILYVSELFVGPPIQFLLGTVNPRTGAATLIGPHTGSPPQVIGLAYDAVDDILFGSDGAALVSVDRATGASTTIGEFSGGIGIYGLAHDPGTDTLYGVSETDLYTIDQVTGEVISVGPHAVAGMVPGNAGLELDRDTGKLFMTDAVTKKLYSLSTATGLATLIGSTGLPINGLASIPTIFIDGFESGDLSAWVTAP